MLDKFKDNARKQKGIQDKIQKEIETNTKRLQEARNLLLDKVIDANEFKAIKEQIEPVINQLSREHIFSQDLNSEYKQYIQFGFSLFRHLDQYYERADIEAKQKLIGSVFPEKLIYYTDGVRTTKVHPAVELILMKNNKLRGNKNGLMLSTSDQSTKVVRRGKEAYTNVVAVQAFVRQLYSCQLIKRILLNTLDLLPSNV